MPEVSTARATLIALERSALEELAATYVIGHSAVCRVASASEENWLSEHVADEEVRHRVAALPSEDLVAMLLPLARVAVEIHSSP
jgi:hypothetical protein